MHKWLANSTTFTEKCSLKMEMTKFSNWIKKTVLVWRASFPFPGCFSHPHEQLSSTSPLTCPSACSTLPYISALLGAFPWEIFGDVTLVYLDVLLFGRQERVRELFFVTERVGVTWPTPPPADLCPRSPHPRSSCHVVSTSGLTCF